MSCAYPYRIPNPNYLKGSLVEYYSVPCHRCLNCLVDKQTLLVDLCDYEWKTHSYNAFVTVTYNDFNAGRLITKCTDNQLRLTLRKKEIQDYLKRINQYLIDNGFDTKKYKVLYCGEYGDKFNRPHAHFCFFGLDYMLDIFDKEWQFGLVESKPLLDGGIRYVCKYITKSTVDKNNYKDLGIEPPFICHSKNLGLGLFLDNKKDIIANNFTYECGYKKRRPVPSYWINRLFTTSPIKHRSQWLNKKYNKDLIEKNMIKYHIPFDSFRLNKPTYSLKQMNQFRHNQALTLNKRLAIQMHNQGIPVEIPPDKSFNFYSLKALNEINFKEV